MLFLRRERGSNYTLAEYYLCLDGTTHEQQTIICRQLFAA